ncbi:MAG: UDP-3-O-(3-hydroxymyristoyl)glucosamine N-acyltransferase [Bdellovibrionota bacterium]
MKSTLARRPHEIFGFDTFLNELKSLGFTFKLASDSKLSENWKNLENPLSSTFKEPSKCDFCYHSKKVGLQENWGLVFRDSKSTTEVAANEILIDCADAAMDFLLRKMAVKEWVGEGENHTTAYKSQVKFSAEDGVVMGPACEIGEGVVLEAGVRIGARVKIGKGTRIGTGSRIADDTVIGDNCYFRGPVSIGGHGFGFISYPKSPLPRHRIHVGSVLIGDGVQLGSFVCVDRGVFEDTVIGNFAATDNIVQIAHNCRVGKHNILCGFVALSGSTVLGDYVTLGGLVVSKGHLTVGNKVQIGAFSALTTDVPDGAMLRGVPARPIRHDLKIMAIQDKLPEIYKQLKGFLKEDV